MIAPTRITSSDRHKRREPCPVCEGGQDDKPHKGVRCTGFVGTDPRYVYCSRVELGTPVVTPAGPCWRHWRGEGTCRCGQTHTLVPVSGPGERPALTLVKRQPPAPINRPVPMRPHGELGTPARVFEARRPDGALMALHARFEWAEEGKDKPAKTLRWWRTGWSLDDLATEDIPLYGMPALAAAPADVPVWLTEGEPACEALQAALTAAGHSAIVLATYGATAIPSDAQLRELVGHTVTLWPDPDADGQRWREILTEKLAALGVSMRVCVWPDAPPKGDAVEYFAAGGTAAGLVALTSPACSAKTSTVEDSAEPQTIGWQARARALEAERARTLDLLTNPQLEAGERIVQWKATYDLDRRGIRDPHAIRLMVNDKKNKAGEVEREGWARSVGMSPGTVLKHLHTLADLQGLTLAKTTTYADEVRKLDPHDHLTMAPAALTYAPRQIAADRVRSQRGGGVQPGAGRKPSVCGNCGGVNLQDRTIVQTVKRTIREWTCPDCGDTHREQVGPDRVIARQNVVTPMQEPEAADALETPTRNQTLISGEDTRSRCNQTLISGGAGDWSADAEDSA